MLAAPPPGLPPIRAMIPVHLYGQAADLDAILPLARRHGVAVIEDCSQAHGATLHGHRLGTLGAIGTFSLYPTKNLGALGDGGVMATNDAMLAERLASLRQYGWRTHYVSDDVGINSRLDEMQAAILSVKLRHLDAGNAARQAIAARYDEALAGNALRPPARRPGAEHVFHQYVDSIARARCAARAAARGRHRRGHPLSGAGAPAAGLRQARGDGTGGVQGQRTRRERGAQSADVSGVDGRSGVGSLRGASRPQLGLAAIAQCRAKSRSCQTTRRNRQNSRIPFSV